MSLTELVHFDKEGRIERSGLVKRLYLSLVVLLVALLSFGLGRFSALGEGKAVKIEYDPSLSQFTAPMAGPKAQTAAAGNALPLTAPASDEVHASKNGTKYHYPYCPGAKQIKEENKITFASAREAEASGYTLAGNCAKRP